MVTFLSVIVAVFRAMFMGKQALVLENLALRQQLGVYLRKGKANSYRNTFDWPGPKNNNPKVLSMLNQGGRFSTLANQRKKVGNALYSANTVDETSWCGAFASQVMMESGYSQGYAVASVCKSYGSVPLVPPTLESAPSQTELEHELAQLETRASTNKKRG